MTQNPPSLSCPCSDGMHDCDKAGGKNSSRQGKPLASTGRCEKVRICKINGDRKMCARMAQLGFLPGSEIELICPGRSDKPCMVRVKGATVTLDELQARQILVTPA